MVEWRRRRLARPPVSSVVTFAAAVAVNVFTRTDAPLCDPESLVQGHAAWHVLTALALALWLADDHVQRPRPPMRSAER
jgi:hypothetical protein